MSKAYQADLIDSLRDANEADGILKVRFANVGPISIPAKGQFLLGRRHE